MAGTYAEFITWPDREEILLANPRPLLTLTGWTAAGGGLTNTYQVTVSDLTTPPTGHATLYRRVIGVLENATELTAQSSAANVDANAGSYFWDPTTGVLYVRTTGTAVDPDTKTVMAARLNLFLATTSIVLNNADGQPNTGRFYAGVIAPSGGPTVVQEMDDVRAGVKTLWDGDLVVTNADKAWFSLIHPDSGYTWKNQQVIIRLGGRYRGQSLDLSQYNTIATMLIEDVAADEATCTFALKPLARLTDVAVPVTPYFETEYPALGDGVRGTHKAILYGRAWVAPALTSTVDFGTWTIADAAYQNLYRVHGVDAIRRSDQVRVPLTEGQDYSVNLTTCTVTILREEYTSATWTIAVDATGKTHLHAEAGGTAGTRGYLSTASEIARDLLCSFAGVKSALIDSTAFSEAHLDAPEELGVWLPSPRTLASILSTNESGQPSIERSVNAIIGQTRAGLWTMRVWDPTYDATTLPILTKQDVAAFSPAPRLESLTTSTRIWFARDGRFTDTWSKADQTDTVQQYLTGVTGPPLEVWTFLRSQGDADVLAARYQFLERYATVDVDFVERGTLLSLTDVGQRVLVTYDPGATATGAYTDHAFVLVRAERGYAPHMTSQGALRDVHRVLNRCGRWKGAAEPTYASASAAQRLLAGYWGAASSPSSSLGWQ